mmetsp:Transcript_19682/g.52348  ORF Transcript_19682/g.52348 Transcript_19682/m.52348 type:complete len:231 (-) Transcript_19682:323-1015(-)
MRGSFCRTGTRIWRRRPWRRTSASEGERGCGRVCYRVRCASGVRLCEGAREYPCFLRYLSTKICFTQARCSAEGKPHAHAPGAFAHFRRGHCNAEPPAPSFLATFFSIPDFSTFFSAPDFTSFSPGSENCPFTKIPGITLIDAARAISNVPPFCIHGSPSACIATPSSVVSSVSRTRSPCPSRTPLKPTRSVTKWIRLFSPNTSIFPSSTRLGFSPVFAPGFPHGAVPAA